MKWLIKRFLQKSNLVLTANDIRSNIFNIVSRINDLDKLLFLEGNAKIVAHSSYSNNDLSLEERPIPAFMEAVKPIRENVTLEQIMAEQNYKPCTYDEFREVIFRLLKF